MCNLYTPPQDSPYLDPDTFHNLENDIAHLSEGGTVASWLVRSSLD